MASTAKDFDEVFDEELHEIRERREVCRKQTEQSLRPGTSDSEKLSSDQEVEARLRDELAGLALSGGGVRSAAFSLGLLQALYQRGRMKDIDYLSTVSGGGYAGALFSASVANDKDGVNWAGDGSRFNRLPIEPRPDGSQPPRIYELALHGRAMSRPIQWLSRHLWGWILTILFVISGVIAIASILAWLMRIVWSHENILSVQAQGFSTDLHISFYPAFLALLLWAFCNLAAVIMRAVNVRIPPISRFAYVLLIVTIVLGMVSFSAIDDFQMSDYVSAQIVGPELSATVNNFLHNLDKIALGLLTVCLLPMLAPHKLMTSGRHREKPLYKFAFNTAGFAIICGVPLAVFFLLSKEDVSGHNLQRRNSDMITHAHLSELEKFIPMLASQRPIGKAVDDHSGLATHEDVAGQIDKAIVASREREMYPPLRKKIVEDQIKVATSTRLLQYMAYQLGLHSEFGELVERRRSATKSKQIVADSISSNVLTNPFLFERGVVNPIVGGETASVHFRDKADGILERLHLEKKIVDAHGEELAVNIEKIRAPRRILMSDYPSLFTGGTWWEKFRDGIAEFKTGNKEFDDTSFRLVLSTSVLNDIDVVSNSSSTNVGAIDKLIVDLRAVAVNLLQGEAKGKPVEVSENSLVARRLTALQQHLHLDSASLAEKLDSKLQRVFGENWKDSKSFADFERIHETEKQHVDSQLEHIRTSNWAVLSAMYPDYIKPRETVYAWNVNAADQAFRLRIVGYSTLVFLFVGLLANLNSMCLHGVYRDQLAAVWLPTGPLMLKDLDTCRNGGPLHLFNATLNRHGKQLDPDTEGMSRFVFSHRFCGSKRFGYRETWEYENGEMGLADAVAISGAAVSTSYAGDLLFRTLLFLTNFRLGQWVRNPKHFHDEHYWPSPIRILTSYLWHPTDRAYVDLTDGGHLDNTGLSSLLERRCRVMIVGDCSDDKEHQFASLFDVLQAARAKYGIQIDEIHANGSIFETEPITKVRCIDVLSQLKPDESKQFESQSHFAVFRLRYPKKRSAVLIVIKPTLTGDEPADLLARRRLNDGFPHDSTVNQFLDPEQFEAYVMLGRHIGEQLDQFIVDGKLDAYQLPAPWRSARQKSESAEELPGIRELPEAEKVMPANAAAETGNPAANQETSDNSEQPRVSSELLEPSAVAQLLHPLHFDKPGIGVAIALVRQWAEAEYENDQDLLSAGRDIFDHIIRPVSKWAYEAADADEPPLALRKLFCSQLMEILEEHTWIANEADQEIRNDFRNMLDEFGDGVDGVSHTIASLSPGAEKVT